MIIKNTNNRIFYKPILKSDPNTGKDYVADMEFVIPAGEQIMIPSGIKVWINGKNTYL